MRLCACAFAFLFVYVCVCARSSAQVGKPLVVRIGGLGKAAFVEGTWETSPQPPSHQSKPPIRGKLKSVRVSATASVGAWLGGWAGKTAESIAAPN